MKSRFLQTTVIRLGVSGVLLLGLLAAEAQAQGTVSFNRDIRPILSNNCFQCHGPDDKERMAELRLDTQDGIFAVVARGKPAESELIARITATEPGKRMPPRKAGKKLTPQEIDLLVRWVKQGADYKQHWSYIKPVRPALPHVKDLSWPKNAIDTFLLARLEEKSGWGFVTTKQRHEKIRPAGDGHGAFSVGLAGITLRMSQQIQKG